MESIKVLRRHELETREIVVGDCLAVSLKKFGNFTTTAYKITEKGVLFIFDEYITSRPMNIQSTNNGGYEESDLKMWIDAILLEAFPKCLKIRISDLSIPTVGELFGHDNKWRNYYEPDENEQIPLMKERRNRAGYLDDELEWGWLRNATKKNSSSVSFAGLDRYGDICCVNASSCGGVRPEFWLVS